MSNVIAPSTAAFTNGPRPPLSVMCLLGATKATVRWSTPPPPGSVSQKQPPGRASRRRFDALPENVCSPLHHLSTWRNDCQTFSGAAAMLAVCFTWREDGEESTTAACAAVAVEIKTMNVAARARLMPRTLSPRPGRRSLRGPGQVRRERIRLAGRRHLEASRQHAVFAERIGEPESRLVIRGFTHQREVVRRGHPARVPDHVAFAVVIVGADRAR